MLSNKVKRVLARRAVGTQQKVEDKLTIRVSLAEMNKILGCFYNIKKGMKEITLA